MPDPRTVGTPWIFRHRESEPPKGVGVEFDGYGPRHGDIVERYGESVVYAFVPPDDIELNGYPENARPTDGFFIALHVESEHSQVVFADDKGMASRAHWIDLNPDGSRRDFFQPFDFNGRTLEWKREIIRDVAPNGETYDWEALIVQPVDAPKPGGWSTAYASRSARLKRATASFGRHRRRVRLELARAEKFDPHEIYLRDDWMCGICQQAIDRDLRWPHPESVSLDHILPLIAGGQHSRGNTQPAHWICNVKKGSRVEEQEKAKFVEL